MADVLAVSKAVSTDVAISAEVFVKNELLCYLQNNFCKSTVNGLVTAISGFYTTDEILTAKCRIYENLKTGICCS